MKLVSKETGEARYLVSEEWNRIWDATIEMNNWFGLKKPIEVTLSRYRTNGRWKGYPCGSFRQRFLFMPDVEKFLNTQNLNTYRIATIRTNGGRIVDCSSNEQIKSCMEKIYNL